jgi:hypothetical protein
MLFKNLETGMVWEVLNSDKIKELSQNEKYERMSDEKTKTIKTPTKKKESK